MHISLRVHRMKCIATIDNIDTTLGCYYISCVLCGKKVKRKQNHSLDLFDARNAKLKQISQSRGETTYTTKQRNFISF